jgi:hypothetical protein
MNDINNVAIQCIFYDNDRILLNDMISHCAKLESDAIDQKSYEILLECLYCINLLYKTIGLAKLVSPDNSITLKEHIIEKYKKSLFKNKKILELLEHENEKQKYSKNKSLIEKILKKFKQNDQTIPKKIRKLTKEIYETVEIDYPLTTTNEMKKYSLDLFPGLQKFEDREDNMTLAFAMGSIINYAKLINQNWGLYKSCYPLEKIKCKFDRDTSLIQKVHPALVYYGEIFRLRKDQDTLKLNFVNRIPTKVLDIIEQFHPELMKEYMKKEKNNSSKSKSSSYTKQRRSSRRSHSSQRYRRRR